MSENEEGKFGEEAKVAQEVFDAKLKGFKIEEQKAAKLKEINDLMGDQLAAAEQSIRLDKIKLNNLNDYIEKLLESNKELTEAGLSIENLTASFGLSRGQAKELADIMGKDIEDAAEAIKNKISEFRAQLELSEKFAGKVESGVSKLANTMGIAANNADTFAGSLIESVGLFFSGNIAKNLLSLTGGIVGLINPLNIVSAVAKKAFDMFDKFDRKVVDIRKNTGRTLPNLQKDMINLSNATAKFGVSLDEVGTALESAQKNLIGVDNLAFANDVANSTSKLKMLGVSTDVATSNINMLFKTFRDAPREDIIKDLENIAIKAESIGIEASKLAQEFGDAMKYLAIEGREKGVKVFEDLAAQAAVTGTAINSMLNMTKAFDKFSEGAKKAAKLNSVLGTSLSSMALMAMDPAERMKELRNQIKMATGGVRNMTRAQKLFTAEAMGYASIQEMIQDLEADPAKIQQRVDLMKQRADITNRLNNAMEKLVPVMDQISRAFENLVRENPQFIQDLADNVTKLVKEGASLLNNLMNLTKVTGYAYGAFQLLSLALSTSNFFKAKANLRTLESIPVTEMDAQAKIRHSQAVATNTSMLNANTLAMARSIGKFALLGAAVLFLIHVLTKPNSPPFYLIFGVIAVGVLYFSRTLELMSPKAIIAALSLAVLAGAISMVFYGMSAFVDSLSGLFTTMSSSAETIPVMALGILSLGAAFLFLGYAASFSALGIFTGLGALTAMLLLFKLTGTSMATLFGAGDEIMKIGTGIEKFSQGLNNIKSAVAEIKSSIGDKGLFAGSISGDTSSIIMGEGVAVAKLFKNNKIEVDVNMPEIAMPKIDVKVYIGSEELKNIVRKEILKGQR